jgi:hypothetical protein
MNQGKKNNNKTSEADYYKLFRDQIEHEDDLINNRTNWLLAAQGLLFAAFGVLIKTSEGCSPVPSKVKLLMNVIPAVGIFVTIFTFLSVLGAVISMHDIKKDWKKRGIDANLDANLPLLQCEGTPRLLGFIAPFSIPVIFIVAWLVILIEPLMCCFCRCVSGLKI